jgi:V/A-type H+-transporting ATPase subunit C
LIARVFKYSFAHAKTRALKSRLLSTEDWHFLVGCKNLKEVLKYLRGTDYAAALSHIPKGRPEAEVISLAIYDELFRDYVKLLKAVPKKSSALLKALLSVFEAENLKTVLRGIWEGRSPSDIRFFLYHLGRLSNLPIAELVQAPEIPAAIELLKPTLFYSSLTHALPQFKAQGKLFPLEVAIDIRVFEHVVETLETLSDRDRKGAAVLIGELIDFENLRWLARFRHFYDLSPEEIINYMLPGGKRLGIAEVGSLARSLDLTSFIAGLPSPYEEVLKQAKDWPEIQPLFERWFLIQLHKVFRQDPFQIRLQLSYLLLRQIEVKALEGLVSAVDLGMPLVNFLELISLSVAGGARV